MALSISATEYPRFASVVAAVEPLGPAPTIKTSISEVFIKNFAFPTVGAVNESESRGGCVSDKNPPGCASQGTGPFLGGAQPPLLGKEGNALDPIDSEPLQSRSHNSLRAS